MRFTIILTFALIFFGCKTTESLVYYSDFKFINKTDTDFHIIGYRNNQLQVDITVPNAEITTIKKEYEHVPMNPGQLFNSDSIEVILNSGKKIIYSWYRSSPTKDYLGNGLGWSESKVDINHYVYSYTLTQEHIDSAR
jgi:hypothetical protein